MSARTAPATIAICVCLTACGGGVSTSAPAAAPLAHGVSPAPHPADQLELARHLPRDTLMFVTARDVFALADAFGRLELIKAFKRDYERAVYQIVRETSHNLLDPQTLAELGIDAHAEVGSALLGDIDDPTLVVGLPVSDEERLKTAIYRMSDAPEVVEGRVVVGDSDAAVVLLGKHALLVVGRRAQQRASALAALDPGEALVHQRAFRVAMRTASARSSVRGYLDMRAALYAGAGLDPRFAGRDAAALTRDIERQSREALARARARGASVDELVAVDQRFADAPRDHSDSSRAAMVRSAFGDVGAMAMAFEVRDESLALRLTLDVPSDSPMSKLLSQPSAPPTIIAELKEAPALLLSVAVEPSEVIAALEMFGQKRQALSQTAGLDVEADLAASMTGEVGIAVFAPKGDGVLDLREAWSPSGGLRALMTIGMKDSKAAARLLARLSDHPELGGMLERQAKGYVLTLPDGPPLQLRARSDSLVVATESALFARSKRAGDKPRWLRADPDRMLNRAASSVVGSIDLGSWLLAMAAQEVTHDYQLYQLPPMPADTSEQYRALRKQLEDINEQLRKRLKRTRGLRLKRIRKLSKGLGRAALRVGHGPHGLLLEARYRGTRPIGELVADLAGWAQTNVISRTDPELHDAQLERLYAEAERLDAKLYQMHLELTAGAKKKAE